jgi:hypothetical protein
MFRTPLPCLGALASLVLALAPALAHARPAYRKALVDLLELPQASRLNDCRTCHLPDKDGAADEKPHNAFGKRLKAVRRELLTAGKPTDLTARILAIADEDSDGDGVPNLLELVTGHSPGDEAVLSRSPIQEEKVECLAFIEALTKRFAAQKRPVMPLDRDGALPASAPELRARENLVQVLLNHHEFVTIR